MAKMACRFARQFGRHRVGFNMGISDGPRVLVELAEIGKDRAGRFDSCNKPSGS